MALIGRLAGKTALVTAAANGIGRATALMLSRQGAAVWATDYDDPALRQVATQLDATKDATAVLDVLDPAAIEGLAERLGRIDVLVNCTGYVATGTLLECSDEDWKRSFDLNVTAYYHMIRAFLPSMLSGGKGASIVNIASVVAVKGLPSRFAYTASKSAIVGLSKSIAADYISDGIRCNVVCPGTVESPSLQGRIHDQAMHTGKSEEEIRAQFVARQPLGRLGTADEVAALVTYLASDEAAFVTGGVHLIDGGMTI